MSSSVLFERQAGQYGDIAVIKLNRPKALNALNLDMLLALTKQLQQWKTDETIKAILIESSHPKAFCAGGDIRQLYDWGTHQNHLMVDFFWHEYRLNHLIAHYPKPYIALLNGITMGGGVGISQHGSHPVATENFLFAMPEVAIGLFPDIGASYLLAHCKDSIGLYLGLTGTRIGAADTKAIGLVPYTLPAHHLEDLKQAILQAHYTHHDADNKKLINQIMTEFDTVLGQATLSPHYPNIKRHFNQASVEGILASLEHSKDGWCQQTREQFTYPSPTSLKITFEAIRRANTLGLSDCLTMEYRLVNRIIRHPDLYEGIRARLIEKDGQPQWQPNRIDLVSDEAVATYFSPLERELDFSQ